MSSFDKQVTFPIIGIFVCILIVLFAASKKPSEGPNNYEQTSQLIEIETENNLYYDPNTMIVYLVFNERSGYKGYGYMSAYYAPNGLPYQYDAGARQLVEITNENN